MADGTMPEKMGKEFDPMETASTLHRRYRQTQLDPTQTIQEMYKTVDALRALDSRPEWQAKVVALEEVIDALKEALGVR